VTSNDDRGFNGLDQLWWSQFGKKRSLVANFTGTDILLAVPTWIRLWWALRWVVPAPSASPEYTTACSNAKYDLSWQCYNIQRDKVYLDAINPNILDSPGCQYKGLNFSHWPNFWQQREINSFGTGRKLWGNEIHSNTPETIPKSSWSPANSSDQKAHCLHSLPHATH